MSRCLYLIFFSIYPLAPDPHIVAHPITGDNVFSPKRRYTASSRECLHKSCSFFGEIDLETIFKKNYNSLTAILYYLPLQRMGLFSTNLNFIYLRMLWLSVAWEIKHVNCWIVERQTYGRRSKSDQSISVKLSAQVSKKW